MFMKDDAKKKIAAIIISRRGKENSTESEEISAPKNEDGENTDYEMGMKTAAEEMISAVESKDPRKLVEATKSLMSMIKDEHEDMERE